MATFELGSATAKGVQKKMETLKDEIDLFISFFHEQFNSIRSVQFKKYGKLYKKILYLAMIDTLSKTIYPRKQNRDRFASFIRNFSTWKFCEKISLPHLVKLLEIVPDPEFSNLRQFAFSRLDQWEEGNVIELDREPDYTEVQKLWPRDKEQAKPIENVRLDFLRHDHLFYAYRNSLIHELREPGYGIEFSSMDANQPFYHHMTHLGKDKEIISWELVYPLGFFESICETVLKKLKTYYVNERINPYSFFTFGTYWKEELNR